MSAERSRGPEAAHDSFAQWLGIRVTGVGEVRLSVRPDLVNRLGKVYGPVIFALVDYAMGDAVWNAIGPQDAAATVSISLNYLTSTDAGEIVCTGKIDRQGRSLAFTSAEIRDDTGKLLTTAVGTFALITPSGS